MRESDPRIRLLANARFSTQLPRNFDHLARSRRSDRMAHREQSSRRANRAITADVRVAARDHPRSLAFSTQTHGFDVKQFFDRERVVQFDYVDILRRNLCLIVRLRNSLASEFGVEIFLAAINPFAPRD